MSFVANHPPQNRILSIVSDSAYQALGNLEEVELSLRQQLEVAGEPIGFVYFPQSCLASVVLEVAGDTSIEVGLVGYEGMTGSALGEYDDRSSYNVFVQGAGVAYRAEAQAFRAALEASPELRMITLKFARSFGIQVASTAFANGTAKLEARLARWLLMVSDRMGTTFKVTHEFLGIMLAVRRSGVTLALQILEGKGLIRSTRGSVTIVDRAGLIEHANGSYGLPEREYERLLGKA